MSTGAHGLIWRPERTGRKMETAFSRKKFWISLIINRLVDYRIFLDGAALDQAFNYSHLLEAFTLEGQL